MSQRPPVTVLAGVLMLVACGKDAPIRGDRHDTAATTVLTLTPRQLVIAGVETESVAVTSVPETFATTGEIEFDPARVVSINAPVTGRIQRLSRNVGDRLAAGDTVATIENPEFLSGLTAVTAPRAGVVTALGAGPRQLVASGAELVRIAAVDRVWMRVDLYGDQARLARPGLAVEAIPPALSGMVIRGRIASVAPSIDDATQAVAARVILDNPGRVLLPGMFTDVRVATGRVLRGMLVPRSAILYDGSRRLVMVQKDSAIFPSVVVTGPVVGDRVVVLRGVMPGERVVVKGASELYNSGYAFTRGAEEEGQEEP